MTLTHPKRKEGLGLTLKSHGHTFLRKLGQGLTLSIAGLVDICQGWSRGRVMRPFITRPRDQPRHENQTSSVS